MQKNSKRWSLFRRELGLDEDSTNKATALVEELATVLSANGVQFKSLEIKQEDGEEVPVEEMPAEEQQLMPLSASDMAEIAAEILMAQLGEDTPENAMDIANMIGERIMEAIEAVGVEAEVMEEAMEGGEEAIRALQSKEVAQREKMVELVDQLITDQAQSTEDIGKMAKALEALAPIIENVEKLGEAVEGVQSELKTVKQQLAMRPKLAMNGGAKSVEDIETEVKADQAAESVEMHPTLNVRVKKQL